MQVHAQIGAVWMNKFCWSKHWSLFWGLRQTHAIHLSSPRSLCFRLHSWHVIVCTHHRGHWTFWLRWIGKQKFPIQVFKCARMVCKMYIQIRVLHHIFRSRLVPLQITVCARLFWLFLWLFVLCFWPSILRITTCIATASNLYSSIVVSNQVVSGWSVWFSKHFGVCAVWKIFTTATTE